MRASCRRACGWHAEWPGPCACCVRLHGRDASLRATVVGLGKFLGDKKLHLVAAIAGKAVNRIGVAQGLQGFGHEHQRLFFDIDNAPSIGVFFRFGRG